MDCDIAAVVALFFICSGGQMGQREERGIEKVIE